MISPSGPRRPAPTACRCCPRVDDPARGVRRHRPGVGVVQEQAPLPRARPPELARRCRAPGRNPRPGHRGLHPRPQGLRRLLRRRRRLRAAGQPGRWRTPHASGVRRELRRVGQRGHRHPRRRHRLHRGPARAVGRVRHVPAAGPRLGRSRGDHALLPPVRPRGRSPLHRAARRPAGVARMGGGEAEPAVRRRGPGHPQRHHVTRGGDAGESEPPAGTARAGRADARGVAGRPSWS